jgi:hypothetical protein
MKISKSQLKEMVREAIREQTTAAGSKYPELDDAAYEILEIVVPLINKKANQTESKMPYKAQYILEQLIDSMQQLV